MNNLFKKLDIFMETRNNDCYFKLDSNPKQICTVIDLYILKLCITIIIDIDNDYEKLYKEIQDLIVYIFKDLEYKYLNIDEVRAKLINITDEMFNQLVEKYPFDFKSICILQLN